MFEIKELTKNQYEILVRMEDDCYYSFDYFFNGLYLTDKQLSEEFKVLREAGLVSFSKGLMAGDYEVAGSGYGIGEKEKVLELIEKYEQKEIK